MNTETTPTSTIHIHPARREDFRPIAALIDERNKAPATQCLISGEGAESIYLQIVAYDEVCEICFAVATCDDRLAGVLGCEFDQDLGRGWLWGPFVLARGRWRHQASKLFEEKRRVRNPPYRTTAYHVAGARGNPAVAG